MGIASKVSMIAQLVLVGFSFGGIPLFGYLYGAKKRDVMRKLIRFCLTFLVSIAVVLSLILCLNSGALMQLFVQDAGMIATGAQMLRWQVYTAAFGGVVLLLTVLFQATGKSYRPSCSPSAVRAWCFCWHWWSAYICSSIRAC